MTSRYWARHPRTTPRATRRTTVVPAPRRLAMAALVITAAGVCAAQPALARVAPHHPREGLATLRNPGPGGGQAITAGRAGGGQSKSGAGKSNQNLNGVASPTFLQGQAQQAIASLGSFDVSSGVCWVYPTDCLIGQNMPYHPRS